MLFFKKQKAVIFGRPQTNIFPSTNKGTWLFNVASINLVEFSSNFTSLAVPNCFVAKFQSFCFFLKADEVSPTCRNDISLTIWHSVKFIILHRTLPESRTLQTISKFANLPQGIKKGINMRTAKSTGN